MNTYGERARRKAPERDRPIRNSLMPAVIAAESARKRTDSSESHARTNGTGRSSEPLECGVETAYTVINDYLRRGYEAAQGNGDRVEPGGGCATNDKATALDVSIEPDGLCDAAMADCHSRME